MADFCNICCAFMFDDSKEAEKNVGNILMNHRYLAGGDINIDKVFKDYMLPNLDKLIANEKLVNGVGGVCEHCGLMYLSVKKEDDILYLVAWCLTSGSMNPNKYKIAIIKEDDASVFLEYQKDELLKYFNN